MEDIRRLNKIELKDTIQRTVRRLEAYKDISYEEFILEILKDASKQKPPASIDKNDILESAIDYFYPVNEGYEVYKIKKKQFIKFFEKLRIEKKIECFKTAQDFEFDVFEINFDRCYMVTLAGTYKP